MCGLAGLWDTDLELDGLLRVRQMSLALSMRGPDDSGAWADSEIGIALGHRRLAILDLTNAGHQPMFSATGRFVLVFNGEIYNHLELRDQLELITPSINWLSHSDTETLLACFERFGIEATLCKTVGMFSIALWDRFDQTLCLARDRLGEKPLYYGWSNGAFIFGSELKALRSFSGFNNEISRSALAQYFRYLYIPCPYSIYDGIYKLPPGSLLVIKSTPPKCPPPEPLRDSAIFGSMSLHKWWSLSDVIEKSSRGLITHEQQAISELDTLLNDAVRLQSLADVPLGAFLSGGVDSSIITAIMQKQSSKPVKTYTVGFEESEFDESPYASEVAKFLGTDHTILRITSEEILQAIHQMPSVYDEPFADSSQIPTFLMCRSSRKFVKVALSGDAGDEIFGGYNRYIWGPRIWNILQAVPFSVRQATASALLKLAPTTWNSIGDVSNFLLQRSAGVTRLGEKVHKLGVRIKDTKNVDDFYSRLVSEWPIEKNLVKGVGLIDSRYAMNSKEVLPSFLLDKTSLRFMFYDSLTYLPDDILCKVDRAAMSVSLETRTPFLDHRLMEFAWKLPLSMKIRNNEGKWLLRQVLYKYVPQKLVDRPKTGFAIPIAQWLRGPLREWAETLIDEARLEREGYLNIEIVHETWRQHLSERYDWSARIWSVLMFQAWLEEIAR